MVRAVWLRRSSSGSSENTALRTFLEASAEWRSTVLVARPHSAASSGAETPVTHRPLAIIMAMCSTRSATESSVRPLAGASSLISVAARRPALHGTPGYEPGPPTSACRKNGDGVTRRTSPTPVARIPNRYHFFCSHNRSKLCLTRIVIPRACLDQSSYLVAFGHFQPRASLCRPQPRGLCSLPNPEVGFGTRSSHGARGGLVVFHQLATA